MNRYWSALLKSITVASTNRSSFSNRQPSENIHVFGFGRGGTTWFAEILAKSLGRSPFIDEPFHRPKVNFRGKNGREFMGWKESINPGENNHLLEDYFKSINNLKHLDRRLISEHQKGHSIQAGSKVIFKYIDRTFLLPYLISNFNIRPIFLNRSPFSIYSSRKRYGWPEATQINVDTAQSKTSLTHLESIQEKYPSAHPPAKIFAIYYCEQLLLFRSLECEKLEVNYEKLFRNNQDTIITVSEFLKINTRHDNVNFGKASSSSRGLDSGVAQLNKWKEQLETEEIAAISETLMEYDISIEDFH